MPLAEPDLAFLDRHLALSREVLGVSVTEQLQRDGRALSVPDALAEATEIASR